jgi:hypothetical protein
MTAPQLRLAAAGLLVLHVFLGPGFSPPPAVAQAPAQAPATQRHLVDFASGKGLREVWAFVEVVTSLRDKGRLPARFVTKSEARDHGWRGGGLCDVWPGHVIGGDIFMNRQNLLPAGHQYFEADLDSECDQRGPRRLVYSSERLIYITIDHYNRFVPVP